MLGSFRFRHRLRTFDTICLLCVVSRPQAQCGLVHQTGFFQINAGAHCTVELSVILHVSLCYRCVCLIDAERWTTQQLLDHSFLKPPSPKNLPRYQDSSPEGDTHLPVQYLNEVDKIVEKPFEKKSSATKATKYNPP